MISSAAATSWNNANALSTKTADRRAEREQVEREERLQACEEALFLRDQTFERQVSDRERRVLAQAMALCLEEVPPGEIVGLMQAEIQNPSSQYLPKAPDLLRRWKGIDWAEGEDGKSERVTVANASAYQPLKPTANELAMRHALPAAQDAEAANEDGPRQGWLALGEKLRRSLRQMAPVQIERATPREETTLGRALREWGSMEVCKVPREVWTEFGWWFLNRTPVAQWAPESVKAAWGEWQQEKLARREAEERAEGQDESEEVTDVAAHAG